MKQRVPLKDATTEEVVLPRRRVVATGDGEQTQMELDVEGFLGYTQWSTEVPPCTGLWEVTDHVTGAAVARWWFDAGRKQWSTAPGSPRNTVMAHEEFAKVNAWRGLRGKPSWPYACPPYDLRTVPQGCELDVAVARVRKPLYLGGATS